LSPEADKWRQWEDQKFRIRKRNWRCNLCNKTFRAEEFLDKHLSLKHAGLLQQNTKKPCLGEMCELTYCEHVEENAWGGHMHRYAFNYKPAMLCDKERAAELQDKCLKLGDDCFPGADKDKTIQQLRNYYEIQFCMPHTCDRHFRKPLPLGPAARGINTLWVAFLLVLGAKKKGGKDRALWCGHAGSSLSFSHALMRFCLFSSLFLSQL